MSVSRHIKPRNSPLEFPLAQFTHTFILRPTFSPANIQFFVPVRSGWFVGGRIRTTRLRDTWLGMTQKTADDGEVFVPFKPA